VENYKENPSFNIQLQNCNLHSINFIDGITIHVIVIELNIFGIILFESPIYQD